jgi:hypothetical protein
MGVQIYKARQQNLTGQSLHAGRCESLTGRYGRQNCDNSITTYRDRVFGKRNAGRFDRNQPLRFDQEIDRFGGVRWSGIGYQSGRISTDFRGSGLPNLTRSA